jgi:hypothetical protein
LGLQPGRSFAGHPLEFLAFSTMVIAGLDMFAFLGGYRVPGLHKVLRRLNSNE